MVNGKKSSGPCFVVSALAVNRVDRISLFLFPVTIACVFNRNKLLILIKVHYGNS